MNYSFIAVIHLTVILITIIPNLFLKFNMNAKNNICQFFIFDRRFPDVRLNRFIMVLARKSVERWYILGLVFGSGKPEPADSGVCVLDDGFLQFEWAIPESGVKFLNKLCVRHIEIEVSSVDTVCLSAIQE